MIAFWAGVLLGSVWLAHWGAGHLSDPLKKLRRQWGFTVVAGGSFIGLAAASPEVGINATSAIRGVGDIGLGALLGSNVLAIPMMVMTAYVATRKKRIGGGHTNHEEHRRKRLLQVDPQAVTVQALPYLAIIGLFAFLTLPKPWRGLQPIDGWILLLGYIAYLAQALLRGREEGERVDWKRQEKLLAAAGVGALAVGAYFTVFSTERIVGWLGFSNIIGGLFITAPVAALPEVFATWYVARSGHVTSGVTSVMGDHVVTMTLAFIPLTIIGMPIENMLLFSVTLAFVAIMPTLYAAFIHLGARQHGFLRWQVFVLPAVYVVYVLLVVFWIQPVQGGQGQGEEPTHGAATGFSGNEPWMVQGESAPTIRCSGKSLEEWSSSAADCRSMGTANSSAHWASAGTRPAQTTTLPGRYVMHCASTPFPPAWRPMIATPSFTTSAPMAKAPPATAT